MNLAPLLLLIPPVSAPDASGAEMPSESVAARLTRCEPTVVEVVDTNEELFDYPISRAVGIDLDEMLHPDMSGWGWYLR